MKGSDLKCASIFWNRDQSESLLLCPDPVMSLQYVLINGAYKTCLKVHKIEIFSGFDFEICIISLLVMSKY